LASEFVEKKTRKNSINKAFINFLNLSSIVKLRLLNNKVFKNYF
jgi:hypothetical protein